MWGKTDGKIEKNNNERKKRDIRGQWVISLLPQRIKGTIINRPCSLGLFLFSLYQYIFPPHPHPPVLIIQLYQGGSAFFCPAWMWKVRPVIKPVIRQTWGEELDHCMSPSSNEQPGSPCRLPTVLSHRWSPCLFWFERKTRREHSKVARLSSCP